MAREDFELDDPGYAPEKFYVRATDKRGHSSSMRIHIPPELHGRIAALIQSAKFKSYKTQGDFYRDAVYHRLYALEHQLHPFEVSDVFSITGIEEDALSVSQKVEHAERAVRNVTASATRLLQLGQEQLARDLVERTLDNLPDYPPARVVIIRMLKSTFPLWIADRAAE